MANEALYTAVAALVVFFLTITKMPKLPLTLQSLHATYNTLRGLG